jgi:uncharacterized membrane-anchored protein YitT (DUF2179 family)
MKPYDKKSKKFLVTTLCMLAGNALLAFLVAAFIIPHDIIAGGVTGIGIVLSKLIPGIDISLVILIMNVLLLLLGLVVLGKKFFLTTVASSLLYPVMLGAFQRIPNIDKLTADPVLAAIFAGCLMGVALGLVMRVGSSTGGMDVLNLVFAHWFHLPVAIFVWLGDIIIVGGQALFSSSEKILLGILVLVLETIILDKAMILGKSQIQIFVVSEQYEAIRTMLLDEIEAGVTMTMIETGRLEQEQKGVLCVIPQRKLYNATHRIQDIDPMAFITITQINEVRGRGFTVARDEIDIPVKNR